MPEHIPGLERLVEAVEMVRQCRSRVGLLHRSDDVRAKRRFPRSWGGVEPEYWATGNAVQPRGVFGELAQPVARAVHALALEFLVPVQIRRRHFLFAEPFADDVF